MTPRAELLDYVVGRIVGEYDRGVVVDVVEAAAEGWCSSVAARHTAQSPLWQAQAHLEDRRGGWTRFVRDVVKRLLAEQAVYNFAVVAYPHPVLKTKSRWRLERRNDSGNPRRSSGRQDTWITVAADGAQIEEGRCHVCGDLCDTHDDSNNPLRFCIDCDGVTGRCCAWDENTDLCKPCAAKRRIGGKRRSPRAGLLRAARALKDVMR